MSDGPHRSLGMRPAWKQLAERADNPAFSPGEVFDALNTALESDWRKEVPAGLPQNVRSILRTPVLPPFRNILTARLESLKGDTAGYQLGNTLLDFAIRAVTKKSTGIGAFREAAFNALTDRATRRLRQIREHYLRESRQDRVAHLTERIRCFLDRPQLVTLVERLLQKGENDKIRKPAKKTRLDDGVEL